MAVVRGRRPKERVDQFPTGTTAQQPTQVLDEVGDLGGWVGCWVGGWISCWISGWVAGSHVYRVLDAWPAS